MDEMKTLAKVVKLLDALESDERTRVLHYVLDKYDEVESFALTDAPVTKTKT